MKPIRIELTCITAAAALLAGFQSTSAQIVEFWDFEDGSDNTPFTDTLGGAANGSGGSYGVNGTLIRGWDDYWGPDWSSMAAASGALGMTVQDEHEDGYVTEGALHNWTSPDWTLQLNVYFETLNGWETIVGRDGSSFAVPESDFYFQRTGDGNGLLRLNYRNQDGAQLILDSATALQERVYYGLAAVGNSTAGTVSLYINDGSGWVLEGQTAQAGNLGVFSSAINWTFGRGWYNGGFGDRLDGYMDDIEFSSVALSIEELRPAPVPEPTSLSLMALGGLLGLRAIRRRAR